MYKQLKLSLLILMTLFAILVSGCTRTRTEPNERVQIAPPAGSEIGKPTTISVQEALTTPINTATPIPINNNTPLIPATATPIAISNTDESASASGGQIVLPTATPIQAVSVSTPISSPSSSGGEVIHVVQVGENLFRIGLKYDVAPETIAAYNGILDVTLIYIGQKLRIPTASGGNFINGNTYIVQNGDTLLSIAIAFDTTTEALISANNLNNPNMLYVGQALKVPR